MLAHMFSFIFVRLLQSLLRGGSGAAALPARGEGRPYPLLRRHAEDDDGLDYQILVEADFLVNMYEDKADADTIRTAYDNIFATESGKMLCRQLFSLEY